MAFGGPFRARWIGGSLLAAWCALACLGSGGPPAVGSATEGDGGDAQADGASADAEATPGEAGNDAAGDAGPEAGADVGIGPWPVSTEAGAPVPMEGVTVFAFSQVGAGSSDPQVTTLSPDMNMRAWQRFDLDGLLPGDYDAQYVTACHAQNVLFVAGTTATAFFMDENPTSFDDWASRDATGQPVDHTLIFPGLYRGTLANPAYRDYLVGIGKIQIDLGVDGLFFDEVYGGYQGAMFNGDEGYDDYHLADFNAYLLWRYAGQDVASLFGMAPGNMLRADVPPGDLTNNFNYRTYLASHGWSTNPLTPDNPLSVPWGPAGNTRGPAAGAPTFFDSAEPYRYFKQIIDALRSYAQTTYGRSIYITANGIWPLVDFQGVGLYDGNTDGPGGAEVDYVPLTSDMAHLDGTQSLLTTFAALRQRSEALAPGAPVVVFIDWPSGPMSRYQSLSQSEKEDYWRLYAAEAYASGIFFAFFLADTTGDPTATESGTMPLFQSLSGFYRAHASLYHGVTPSTATATTSVPALATTVMDQAQPARRIVHVVNHDYAQGFVTQAGVSVSVPSSSPPAAVTLASPDAMAEGGGDEALSFTYAAGTVTVTVPSIVAYDAVVIAY